MSYGSNFYPDVASNVGLRTSGLKEEELVGVVERLAAGLRDDVTELNLDLAEEVVARDPVHVEHFQNLAEDWNTILNAYGAVVVAQVDYVLRGPRFDSHWELGFLSLFSSLSHLSISGVSLIRSLVEVQHH